MQVETMRFILKSLNDRFGTQPRRSAVGRSETDASRIADVAGNVCTWDERRAEFDPKLTVTARHHNRNKSGLKV